MLHNDAPLSLWWLSEKGGKRKGKKERKEEMGTEERK